MPRTATNTAVSSQLLRPRVLLSFARATAKASLTGLFCIFSLFIKRMPVNIFSPISKPLNIMGVGQSANTFFDAAASTNTLNSYPPFPSLSIRAAIDTSCFTFLSTNAAPESVEYSSAPEISNAAKLLKKPTLTMVTDLSGCADNICLYNFTASIAAPFDFNAWGYLAIIACAHSCLHSLLGKLPLTTPTGIPGLLK